MAKRTRRKRAPATPENEDARQKFLRIGQPRMNRALSAIRLLGNMSNPQYQWYESDVVHMKVTLISAVNEMMEHFEAKLRKRERPVFHFVAQPEATSAPSDEEVLGLRPPGTVSKSHASS